MTTMASTRRPHAALPLVLAAIAAALLIATASARSLTGPRVLAVVDDEARYSTLLGSLSEGGYNVTVQKTAAGPELFSYGERTADHLLHLAPSKPLRSGLSAAKILHFVNAGGNVLVGVDTSMTDSHRDLAYEMGLHFDAKTPDLEDAVAADVATTNPDAARFAASQITHVHALVSERTRSGAPVLYRGVGHTLASATNSMVATLLWANPTTTMGGRTLDEPVRLVSGLQALNNARVAFVGSLDALSDAFMDAPVAAFDHASNKKKKHKVSGNKMFADELVQWTFQEKSVLRVAKVTHHKVDCAKKKQLDNYRIKDEIMYNITLQEWSGAGWAPHMADQLQFTAKMIDPYIRAPMHLAYSTPASSTYSATVKLPDVWGVFTFLVDYRRTGYSWIDQRELVSVRAFHHDEYPRFLAAAYPYYAAAFSHMLAFAVFSALWLTHKHPAPSKAAAAAAAAASPETSSVTELLRDELAEEQQQHDSALASPKVAAGKSSGRKDAGEARSRKKKN